MSTINSNIPVATGQRSNRDLSARSQGTTDFGRLDVLYHTEINPNEDFHINWKGVLKGATMPVPTKANMYYDVRWFFVPWRVLTHRPEEGKSNFVWDYFIEKLSNTSHPYTRMQEIAYLLNGGSANLSSDSRIINDARRLISQLRLPEALFNSTAGSGSAFSNIDATPFGQTTLNVWPFMSYQRIWWDFYRDKSLIDESLLGSYIPLPTPGLIGTNSLLRYYIMPRYACWPKDYFTNARDSLGGSGDNEVMFVTNQAMGSALGTNNVDPQNIPIEGASTVANRTDLNNLSVPSTGNGLYYSAIRMARLVDNYLQRMNIAGTSLVNRIFARFGVRPQEQIIWQSQYVGGLRYDIQTGDVLSNIETGSVPDQAVNNAFNYNADGSQSGQSTGIIYKHMDGKSLDFYSKKDYGTLMCIGSLVPYTGYYQGLHRGWIHGTLPNLNDARASYFTPEFANQGLQPIKKQELFGNAATTQTLWDSIFGFGERYGEYAYQPDVVDGDVVLSATKAGMSALHLFREFSAMPSLTATFTHIDPAARESLDRIFNYLKTGTPDESLLDHFERYFVFDINANRGLSSSMLPDLFEDNNHGNVINVPVGGTRF